MGIWFAFEKCLELESHLLPESSYLKSLSLKKKKHCIPTGATYSELADLFPISWRNLFLWLVCFSGFCLFLFLFLRKGVSVAALELTRLPGLELGNDLLVSASWVPGLKMWHVMLSDLNEKWEMTSVRNESLVSHQLKESSSPSDLLRERLKIKC